MIVPNKLYNNQIELQFDEFKHAYFVKGVKVPSVTQILSVINKPALINWAANMAVESIQSEIKPGVAYGEMQLVNIFEAGRKAHNKRKTDAANIGTFVHEWVAKYIKGQKPEMPFDENLKVAVGKFLDWQKQYDVKFILAEEPIFSQEYQFAGTLDWIAKIDGKLVLGDLKTSSGIYDEYWLQVAAYQLAREEEFPTEKYDYRGIIRIGKDGSFEWQTSENYQNHKMAFISTRQLYDFLEGMKKK